MTEEQMRRRREAMANMAPPVIKRVDEEEDGFWKGYQKPAPLKAASPKTEQAREPTAPVPHPSADEMSTNLGRTTTDSSVSQPESVPNGKVSKWGKLLTADPPYYIINKQLAGCWDLSGNERCLIGLLNFLMKKNSYASVSFEQLAYWIGLHERNSPKSMAKMIRKLREAEFLDDLGVNGDKHQLVVRSKWRDAKKHNAKKNDDRVPF